MNTYKAILAAVLAGLTALVTDLQGRDDVLTLRDWVIIIVAALVAGGGTWLVPPGPGITTPRARHVPGGQAGQATPLIQVLVAVLLVLIIIWFLSALL